MVYLQGRKPPVFHRDIKPENILIDDNNQAYLVDFGLARIGDNTLAVSSLFGGTMGFMPPEQIHNQKLSKASDLYGLGVTLICLITNTNSANIGRLVDFSTNKINFKNQVIFQDSRFVDWLEKMVEPLPTNRYPDAVTALNELKLTDSISFPESHQISYSEVISRLGLDDPEIVQKALLASQKDKALKKKNQPPYGFIATLGLGSAVVSGAVVQTWQWLTTATLSIAVQNFLFAFSVLVILLAIAFTFGGDFVFPVCIVIAWGIFKIIGGTLGAIVGIVAALIIGVIVNQLFARGMVSNIKKNIGNIIENNFYNRGFNGWVTLLYVLLTTATSVCAGILGVLGFSSSLLIALCVVSFPLAGILGYYSGQGEFDP